MLDIMMRILYFAASVVKLLSVLILVVGLLLNIKDVIVGVFLKNSKKMNAVRNNLGTVILLSLEILIIADIIETIINPTFQDVGLLAAIVAIRTAISFFLNKEMEKAAALKKDD